jgi:hypothetical protein
MIHNQAPIHQGNYDPAYLAQNIHYALLGNNQMSPTDPTAAEMSSYPNTFLLNKSLFKVHAEHHHTFSPYWMKQFEPVGHIDPTFANAIGIGPATQKSAYMGTFRDKIKLKTKLSAKGNVSVSQTPTYNGLAEGPGWTNIGYADVPATDQLFTITWCSQGDDSIIAPYSNAFHIQETCTGVFHVSF